MGLQDALRRAAGLLIEIPPEAPAEDEDDVSVEELLAEHRDASPEGDKLAQQSIGPGGRRPAAGATGETKTVEEIVRQANGPDLDAIAVAADGPMPQSGAPLDFDAIYQAAKLPVAGFTAEQMLDMLTSLPSELPLETKRQTVKVTLAALGKNLGATPETVVADASRKMAALAAYEEFLTKRTEEFVTKTESEIDALQTQLDSKRKAILETRQSLTSSSQQCEVASRKLNDVLEFFSLDLPPSQLAPDTGEKKPKTP